MISTQILLFFNVILLSIIITTATIQDQIDGLSKDEQESILKILLSTPTSRSAVLEQAKNWCCKINPGTEAASATRQTTYYIQRYSRHKCGYNSCGLFGWSKCTRWCSETWVEAQYGTETYTYYIDRSCPNQELMCCAEHLYILGHCISFMEVHANQILLAHLNDLGIVIPGPPLG